MSDPWVDDTERYGDPDQARRWDEADRQADAEHARLDRQRDRAGHPEHARVYPRCDRCGRKVINWGAHAEACGETVAA